MEVIVIHKAKQERKPKGWFPWPSTKQEPLSDGVNLAIDNSLKGMINLSYTDRLIAARFVLNHIEAM